MGTHGKYDGLWLYVGPGMDPVRDMWVLTIDEGSDGSMMGNFGPVRYLWVPLGICGSCLGNVGLVREMWVLLGKCGSC